MEYFVTLESNTLNHGPGAHCFFRVEREAVDGSTERSVIVEEPVLSQDGLKQSISSVYFVLKLVHEARSFKSATLTGNPETKFALVLDIRPFKETNPPADHATDAVCRKYNREQGMLVFKDAFCLLCEQLYNDWLVYLFAMTKYCEAINKREKQELKEFVAQTEKQIEETRKRKTRSEEHDERGLDEDEERAKVGRSE